MRDELESKTVSEKTRQSIAKNFSDLVKFVFSRPDCTVEPELAACLNALHRFRNDAYHGDFVRADVLGPANEIYFYLCCRLLKAQTYLMMEMGDPPAVVRELLPSLQASPSRWSDDEKTLGDAVADELLARNHLDHGGITSALSAHLGARVASVERDLNQFMEYFGYEEDRPLALRVIQLLPLSVEPPVRPADFLTRPLVVTDGTILSWARGAAAIGNLSSAQHALRQFDEIESAIARFENELEPFIIAVDLEIQREIDRARGKLGAATPSKGDEVSRTHDIFLPAKRKNRHRRAITRPPRCDDLLGRRRGVACTRSCFRPTPLSLVPTAE